MEPLVNGAGEILDAARVLVAALKNSGVLSPGT